MDNLQRRLTQHELVGIDTAVFIYHLEAHPTYLPLTKIILNGVQFGYCQAITSTLTIMELNVRPWQLNRPDVARKYEAILANFPNLTLVDTTRAVARRAAQLRAQYNLRPADAVQVATAVITQATAWITNDKQHKRVAPLLDVIILNDFC